MDTTIALYGHFNLRMLNWTQSLATNITSKTEKNTIEVFNESGLMQINSILNDNDRMLDLVWTNEPDICFCKLCDDNILHNEVHHKSLNIEIEFECKILPNANYEHINNDMQSIVDGVQF